MRLISTALPGLAFTLTFCSLSVFAQMGLGGQIVFVRAPEPIYHPFYFQQTTRDAKQEARLKVAARALLEQAQEREHEEEQMLILCARQARDAQPPIDPAKDEYKKYCDEQRRREEDPDFAAMRPEPRDEYKAWKESSNYTPPVSHKQEEKTPASGPPIDKQLKEWLSGGHPPAEPKPKHSAEIDE